MDNSLEGGGKAVVLTAEGSLERDNYSVTLYCASQST